jgi:hypothetical protein
MHWTSNDSLPRWFRGRYLMYFLLENLQGFAYKLFSFGGLLCAVFGGWHMTLY